MKEKFIALLTFTSSLKNFGIKFIRVAILVVFVWIGGLKYFHYEADGIVPFVAIWAASFAWGSPDAEKIGSFCPRTSVMITDRKSVV